MYNFKYNFFEFSNEIIENFPIVLSSVGTAYFQQNTSRPMGLDAHQLIWVKEGAGVFCIDGKTSVLTRGQGVFFRQGVPHSYRNYGESFSTGWCAFKMPENSLDLLEAPRILYFNVPDFLNDATDELQATTWVYNNEPLLVRCSVLCWYLNRFFNAVLESKTDITSRVNKILKDKFYEPLTLTKIAEYTGAEEWRIARQFKKDKNISVMQALKLIRISNAKILLRQSTFSIKETGEKCGFFSTNYFIKCFKKDCGMTPNEYRKSHYSFDRI